MIDLKVRLEIDQFNAACRAMAARLGNSTNMRQIIESEVSKIIIQTMRRTKMATQAAIMARASQPWRRVDIGHGLQYYYLLNLYPNKIWDALQKRITQDIENRLKARGLSRRAWYELGLRVGPVIQATAQVRRAVSARGHTGQENVAVTRQKAESKFGLIIENRSPLLTVSGGGRAFESAVRGRRQYYVQSLAHGVFDDLKKVAARYPGLLIQGPPPPAN